MDSSDQSYSGHLGNFINPAIQCLYLLEVRVDYPEDLVIADVECKPEADPAPLEPAHPEPASIEFNVDPVAWDVEPNSTGSAGEYVGNRIEFPTASTRSGRQPCPPSYLGDYFR